MPMILCLLLGIAALVGWLMWRGEGSTRAGGTRGPSGQPAAGPFDHQARAALASDAELFYLRLREAVAPSFDVWAGTPVVDLVGLRAETERGRRPMLEEALAGLRTDFAVVRAAEVVAVIALETPDRHAREDAFRDAVLRQCGYRVLRFDPGTGVPKVGALRDWLGPVLRS